MAFRSEGCGTPVRTGRAERQRTTLASLCARAVSLDESTRCRPDRKVRACYQELQRLHDATARALGATFTAHRQWRQAAGS